ncbi:MAG: glycosyltransferase family 4 protein, partial [Candidatus Aenigmarchaeota archaeon]|nr:glycosyltransferase family 4 protein [Candidatus Aenigmarchaeota archaeon]MDW8149101.1 glycosyltransferase family 4 protein [Candidatus Aenigmarchaeota archaeon]
MKVALVHDWLTGMRGGEKVLEALCELFPNADLYTLVHIRGSVSEIIENRKIYTSFIQKLPDVEKNY